MADALQRRGSLPNKIMLALQLHSEQHQTATTFEVRGLHCSGRLTQNVLSSVLWWQYWHKHSDFRHVSRCCYSVLCGCGQSACPNSR